MDYLSVNKDMKQSINHDDDDGTGNPSFSESQLFPDMKEQHVIAKIIEDALLCGSTKLNSADDLIDLLLRLISRFVKKLRDKYGDNRFPKLKTIVKPSPCDMFGFCRLLLHGLSPFRVGVNEGRHRICILLSMMTGQFCHFANSSRAMMFSRMAPFYDKTLGEDRKLLEHYKSKVFFTRLNNSNQKVVLIPTEASFNAVVKACLTEGAQSDETEKMKSGTMFGEM